MSSRIVITTLLEKNYVHLMVKKLGSKGCTFSKFTLKTENEVFIKDLSRLISPNPQETNDLVTFTA